MNAASGWLRSRTLAGALATLMVGTNAADAQEAVSRPVTASPAPRSGKERSAAQPTNRPGGAETERIVVTGSRIPTASDVGANPVLTIDREMIEKSGERTAEELIRNLTVAGPNGVPTSNNATGFTPGASSISLRGFDPSDTLTLIDGRRVAPYPLGAGTAGTSTFVDLNSIPRAAIDSIEILKDGASTTYGADAVAGVVNIKLRHDYRGAEANVAYGNTLDKDSSEFSASLLFGTGDSKTNVAGVLNFYHRNSIFNRDRGFSLQTLLPSSNANPFNLQLSRDAVVAAGGNPPPSLGDTFFGHAPFLSDGRAPASDYVYTGGRSVIFNYNSLSGSLPDSERYGGFLNADHKVFGEQMVLYADLSYQNVTTRNELAPSPTGNFLTPGQPSIAIPPHAPGATLGGPSYADTGVPAGAYNPFNPFQQIISGGTRARMVEFGNRIFKDETDAFFSTIGVKGDDLFDGSWGYDGAFRYSQIKNTSTTANLISASRFNRILNAADPIFDPASAQYIGTTVPYNPFGDYRTPIATNASLLDFARVYPNDIDLSKLATLDLNIYTTSLFKLPAGGVGLAFGGQFRRENLRQDPDALYVAGDIVGGARSVAVNAGRKTYALYAEADFPLFGPSFTVPGFRALDFTASMRFEDFPSNDTNVLVPKFGVRWQPFDESLTVRATWGEGFREPSLIELFGNPRQGFAFVTDPLTQTFLGEVPFILRSNPNLQSEDSRSFSGGIVYTPKFLRTLAITIDLFDIETKGRVVSPDIQNVVDRAFAGQSLLGERVDRDANGDISLIETTFLNSGSQKTRGVDLGLQYQIETRLGIFTWLTQATYLESFEFAELPGAREIELRSSGLTSDEGYLKWKANSRLDWTWDGFDVGTTVHYLDGFHEINGRGLEHYVKQTWFFDVQASCDFNGSGAETAASPASVAAPIWNRLLDGTTVTLGCNNVFGHDPPDAYTTTNYPGFAYDATGRFVYVSLRKKF